MLGRMERDLEVPATTKIELDFHLPAGYTNLCSDQPFNLQMPILGQGIFAVPTETPSFL